MHCGQEADVSLLQREGRPQEDVQQPVSFVWVLSGSEQWEESAGQCDPVFGSSWNPPSCSQPGTCCLPFCLASGLGKLGVEHGAGLAAQLFIIVLDPLRVNW